MQIILVQSHSVWNNCSNDGAVLYASVVWGTLGSDLVQGAWARQIEKPLAGKYWTSTTMPIAN